MNADKNTSYVDILYTLSCAFKNAIEGGFVSREQATTIFKNQLRVAGFEVAKKEEKKGKEE